MSGMVTQTRSKSTTLHNDVFYRKIGTQITESYHQVAIIPGSQTTTSYRSGPQYESELLPQDLQVFQPARYAVGTHDSGHEFSTINGRLLTTTSLSNFWTTNREWDFRVNGSVILEPRLKLNAAMAPEQLTKNQLMVLGGRAINATIPTKPEAGLSQFLGELRRDGIPQIPGYDLISKSRTRDLGGEVLNWEFGWKPVYADITKLLHSVVNSAEILRQFRRDSGRVVRRSFAFPETKSTTITETPTPSGAYVFPFVDPMMYRAFDKITITDAITENVWFSGAYSYYLDVGDSLISKAEEFEQKANHLLGIRMTADVLWDLAPWSWFADWFGTIGTALSNVSALQEDGLVIRYGYLMRHSVIMRTVRSSPWFYNHERPTPISSLYRTERKERYKATPYGFGLDLAGFTPRQWTILAALGLTKAPGRMK